MTTFVFVRHAVTEHTNKKLSGWMPNLHLTKEGRAQAEAAAETLAGVRFAAIYSSPILRTMETARTVAARHNLDVQARRGLGEVRYGGWEDRSLKTLARTKLWTTVQRFPSAARFPDGESLREVQARALAELEDLVGKHRRGTVCCVSHGDVIRLVAAHYLGVHIDLFQRIAISPGSISVIAVGEHGPMVLSLNAVPALPSNESSVADRTGALAGAGKRKQ